MRKLNIYILLILFGTLNIFGQNKECDCSVALDKSLKNKYTEKKLLDLRIELYEYYKFLQNNSEASVKTYRKSTSLEAFTSYGLFGGSSGKSGGNQSRKIRNLKKIIDRDQSISEKVFKQIAVDVFSNNQLEAYKACLRSCPKKNGVFYEVTGDIEDVFAINLSFTNTVGKYKVTLKNNATLVNCEPIGGFVLKKGFELKNNHSIIQYLKIINRKKAAHIGVNFNEVSFGDIHLGNEYFGSSKSLPIGTIISSLFRYQTYLEVNKFKATDNMSKAIWVPCDGRNVSSSRYGEFSGSVPDLRGLFLRNVNDYNVPFDGVREVKPLQANPDNTPAGVFQNESIQSHTHGLQWYASGGMELPNIYPGINNSYNPKPNQASSKGVSPTGGNETRPKNMSVYYYIKIN